MGRRVRVPGRQLLEKIRAGSITEIVDIGCAGALDPSLRKGDLVLSNEDVAFDSTALPCVGCDPSPYPFLREVAADRGVSLRHAPILTHERFVASRDERIALFDRTGCVAVQMEHAWFLQLLQSMTAAECFEKIRVTHLVLITDTVPGSSRRMAAFRSGWDALVGYALPLGSAGIMALRREVLNRWPTP
jgi:purine-nucleoside phosphorylase